jgi:hypothetical protein
MIFVLFSVAFIVGSLYLIRRAYWNGWNDGVNEIDEELTRSMPGYVSPINWKDKP